MVKNKRLHRPALWVVGTVALLIVGCTVPTPTATPTPIATPTIPIATPTPTVTPTPPPPTGDWSTWEEIRAEYGVEYGSELPRIALVGQDGGVLHVDCQMVRGSQGPIVKREVYVSWTQVSSATPVPLPGAPALTPVSYAVDGAQEGPHPWINGTSYEPQKASVFARLTQANDIVRALLAGGLELTVEIGGVGTYTFLTHGFSKAYEHVRARCRELRDMLNQSPLPEDAS